MKEPQLRDSQPARGVAHLFRQVRVVCVASKGGADHHPAWYLNVVDSKELAFQIATQAFRASWREPAGADSTARR